MREIQPIAYRPQLPEALSRRDRAVASFLLALMVVGSFCVWTVVPMGVLYGLSLVTISVSAHYLSALVAVPLAMTGAGALLAWINAHYIRITRAAAFADDGNAPPRRVHGPLGMILSSSLVVALLALLAWLAMFGGHAPQAPGSW